LIRPGKSLSDFVSPRDEPGVKWDFCETNHQISVAASVISPQNGWKISGSKVLETIKHFEILLIYFPDAPCIHYLPT